ncbi:MAG: prolipoprotein diacylglyceryl transferase [Chitinophagales bacterium]|nr:prolipoprotein diacylglyceryl transferase [Chitinophagaceae bacterium]MCB9064745.1 prolipoprotein diacylglyceryl transferase [Chitinophagales bacterium]
MYPDFEYFLENLFGTDMPEWLSIFKTFGFLVALAFLAAAWTLTRELKRKEEQGLLQPTFSTMEVGHPATMNELLWSILSGFLLGYKLGGMFGNVQQVSPDPLGYIFSLQGNFVIGLIGAILFGYMKYAEKKKQQLPEPTTKKIATHPHQRVMEILLIAAVSGMAGAKIFNALETWDQFLADPIENLFSSSGLTFYGGLIVATISLYIYARKHKIPFMHLCDAVAPGLILAYGLGRLGCHFAGDGDWGIFNSAYITNPDGSLRAAAANEFQQVANNVSAYYKDILNIPHVYAPAPDWLPDWIYGMNYAHNVNHDGIPISGCTENYCAVLPVSVFPTPLYEFAACMILFGILWKLRTKLKYPLQLFGIYLIFNGLERFFIEKIRVNFKYDLGFIHPTQAEIISTVLVLTGLILWFVVSKRFKQQVN